MKPVTGRGDEDLWCDVLDHIYEKGPSPNPYIFINIGHVIIFQLITQSLMIHLEDKPKHKRKANRNSHPDGVC